MLSVMSVLSHHFGGRRSWSDMTRHWCCGRLRALRLNRDTVDNV